MSRWILFLLTISLFSVFPAAAQDDSPMIARGFDISFEGWSDDSAWIAYYMHEPADVAEPHIPFAGDLHFYNRSAGIRCVMEDRRPDARTYGVYEYNRWLHDGSFLYLREDGGLERFMPCTDETRDLSALFPEPLHQIHPSSPSGRQVILASFDAYYVYEPDTDLVRPVQGIEYETFGGRLGVISWSPDETQFAISINDYAIVYVVEAATGQARRVFEDPAPVNGGEGSTAAEPIWLDSDTLFLQYMPSYGDSDGVVVVNFERGVLDWTFDGTQYLFRAGQHIPNTDAYIALLEDSDMHTWVIYRSADHGLERLGEDVSFPDNPFTPFNPTTTHVLEGGGSIIGVRPLESPGSTAVWLLEVSDYPFMLWSPSGTRFAVGTQHLLYLTDITGAHAQAVIRTDYAWYFPQAWSPDGEWLAYEATYTGGLPDHEENQRQALLLAHSRSGDGSE